MARESVEETYRRTGSLVLNRCRLLLGDTARAEDAMQEVYIRLLKYGDSLREEKVPLSWLYRTSERVCFDRMRKLKREPAMDPVDLEGMLPVGDGTERQEAARVIGQFFHKLDPKLMQLALLHYFDGLPQERIAAELNWSRRTVGKKLKQLKERAERLARRVQEDAS